MITKSRIKNRIRTRNKTPRKKAQEMHQRIRSQMMLQVISWGIIVLGVIAAVLMPMTLKSTALLASTILLPMALRSKGRQIRVAMVAPPFLPVPRAGIRRSLWEFLTRQAGVSETLGAAERVIAIQTESLIRFANVDVEVLAPGDSEVRAPVVPIIDQNLVDALVARNIDPWAGGADPYVHDYENEVVRYLVEHQDEYDLIHVHMSFSSRLVGELVRAGLVHKLVLTSHTRFPMKELPQGQQWDESMQDDADEIAQVPAFLLSEAAWNKAPSFIQKFWIVMNGIQSIFITHPLPQPEDYAFWYGTYNPGKAPHLAILAALRAGWKIKIAGVRTSEAQRRYFATHIQPLIDQSDQIEDLKTLGLWGVIYHLSRARVFIQPWLWWEPGGMVLMEALCLGVPVIVLNRGYAAEVVEHEIDGYVVNTRNPNGDEMHVATSGSQYEEQLINDIAYYMDHLDELISRPRRRRRAARKFGPRKFAKTTVAAYRARLRNAA